MVRPALWIMTLRKAIIWVGFGWLGIVLLFGIAGGGPWVMIGLMLLFAFLLVPALAFALIVPSYIARIISVPLFLAFLYNVLLIEVYSYQDFVVPVHLAMWFVTITAVTLLIPEFQTPRFLYKLWRRG